VPDHRSAGTSTFDLGQANERLVGRDSRMRHIAAVHRVFLLRAIQSVFPKQVRDPVTQAQAHLSEILTPVRFAANSIPILGPCSAIFTPFSFPN
jgi:hypothetical protein